MAFCASPVLASVETVAAATAAPVVVVAVVPLTPAPLVAPLPLVPPVVPPPLVLALVAGHGLAGLVTVGVTAGAPTDATPMLVMGAFTQVLPTVALLVCAQLKLMVTGPLPEVAALPVDGVTVCVIDPVVPSPPLLVVPEVVVGAPCDVLLALGDTLIVRLQPLLELLAEGVTVMVFPLMDPVPVAEGLLVVLEVPPVVVLVVVEFELAFAAPEPDSSLADPLVAVAIEGAPLVALPVVKPAAAPLGPALRIAASLVATSGEASPPGPLVADAVEAAPVVVLPVEVVALAPEPLTVPLPLAIIGAVRLVLITEALLVWFEEVVTDTRPLPASAVLLVEGVTVCVIAPVGPASSHSELHDRLELAVVMVSPPVAVLSASGLTWIDVLPPRLKLEEDGLTVIQLCEILPKPKPRGSDQTQASPPRVWLDVLETAFAQAGPLDPSSALPVVAVAVAAWPVVVDVVVELALAGDPLTVPVPFAAIPALTVVGPVDAELACDLLAVMVVAPLPAVAVLWTEGVTV